MPRAVDHSPARAFPRWLPAGALFVLLMGAGIWWMARSPVAIEPGPSEPAPSVPQDLPDEGDEPARLEIPEPEPSGGLRQAANAETDPEAKDAAAPVELDLARPIRGRAVPDAPLPRDASLEIVVETLANPDRELSEMEQRMFTLEGLGDQREWTEVARVTALPDGTFEAPRPLQVSMVRLRATGDYVSQGEVAFEVDGENDPGETRIELPVSIGAYVTLELQFKDPPSPKELAQLAGDRLQFRSFGRSDYKGGFSRGVDRASAILGPDGRAVMGAVSATDWWESVDSGDSSDQPLAPFRVPSGFHFEPDPGDRITVKVPMERGVRLEGRVTDENGMPIERAEIDASGHWRSGGARGSHGNRRTSDEEGLFIFQALPADLDEFTVKAEGFLPYELGPKELALLLQTPGPHAIVLRRGRDLKVMVRTPEGGAAKGVALSLTPVSGEKPHRASTQEDGTALFSSLPAGDFRLSALGRLRPELQKELPSPAVFLSARSVGRMGAMEGSDPSVETLWGAATHVPSGRIDTGSVLSLDLSPLPMIRGQVSGADPSWPGPLVVSVYPPNSRSGLLGRMPGRKGTFALNPETGRFEGQLPPGSYEAEATAGRVPNGRMTADSPKVHTTNTIAFDVAAEDVQLDLSFGASQGVEGIVKMEDGTPLGGVAVQLSRFEGMHSLISGVAQTDPLGHFAFEDLRAGTYSIRTVSARFMSNAAVGFQVVDGQPTDFLEVIAERAGAVRAIVVDAGGEPIPDVLIRITKLDGSPTYARAIEDVPEWDGALGPLRAGQYVAVWPQPTKVNSTLVLREPFTVRAGELTELRLSGSGEGALTATGRVTVGGDPAPEVEVRLIDDRGLASIGLTDAEGRYSLECIPVGDVTVQAGGYARSPIAAAPLGRLTGATDVPNIDLPSGAIEGTLMGDVMLAGFGQAAVRRIGDAPSAPPFRYSGGSSNGFFTIEYLPDGVYELIVTGHRSKRMDDWKPQTIEIKDGQRVRGIKVIKNQ